MQRVSPTFYIFFPPVLGLGLIFVGPGFSAVHARRYNLKTKTAIVVTVFASDNPPPRRTHTHTASAVPDRT